MKLVVSQRLLENETYPETRDALDVAWGRWFGSLGWLPFPVATTLHDLTAWFDALRPDGVLLTGGNDLAGWNESPLSAMRDAFEARLVELALGQGLPVVGICRGAQFLAHCHGAQLARIPGHVAVRHSIHIRQNHPLANCFEGDLEVNSFHNLGITQLPDHLLPLAGAADGSIEAFTHADLPLLGIMWHPERETPFQACDQKLVRAFYESRGKRV